MSLTSNTAHRLIAILVSPILFAGCSDRGDSSFVYSDRTLSLMNEAQTGFKDVKGVRELVDERFGNPQTLVAWQKLPVDFGGIACSVATTPDASAAVKSLQFEFAEGNSVPEKVSSLQFVTGACSGETAAVLKWDAATGTATLVSALQNAPAQGDQVTFDGGSTLKNGRMLYQRHCSHCHGTSGDGNGPTAQYLYPRPRDYRHGVFKFTSTNDTSKASRNDLTRIVKQGIPGTYMPSFLLLNDSDIHAIVEYVRFLAMRGEFERKTASSLASSFSRDAVTSRVKEGEKRAEIVEELKAFIGADLKDELGFISDELAETWSVAQTEEALVTPKIPRVADTIESRRRGRELYLSKTLNCANCHGISGRGDGPQTTDFEKNPVTNELYPEPGLHDVWDNLNQPRNLVYGIYRGGRRPIDLFARIHAGIKGSRMPSFKNVEHEDIWHIVNYVLSVPYEVEPGASASSQAAAPAAAAASL